MGSKTWQRTLALALLLSTWQALGCARQDPDAESAPFTATQTTAQPAKASADEAPTGEYEPSRPSEVATREEPEKPTPKRRALLVGINDYDYPVSGRPIVDDLVEQRSAVEQPVEPQPSRKMWPGLKGPLNDVAAVGDVLESRYGFESEAIEVLLDSAATREAILRRIDEFLVAPSQPGDSVFFYFAGHGSYVPSSAGGEADKLDETIVPYDSKLGAEDIRDKELRARFNRILDRGAALTVVFDSCHSGSAARGYPVEGQPRGLDPMRVPLAELQTMSEESAEPGPVPAERGALVWSAAEEDRSAYETVDEHGNPHGAFTLAWLRAIRDAGSRAESASYLFKRTRGWLLAEARYQEPSLAGRPEVKQKPLFGESTKKSKGSTVIAVERRLGDGRIELQGGWAQGLGIGSRLRLWDPEQGAERAEPELFEIVEVLGWGRSIARPLTADQPVTRAVTEPTSTPITSGALLKATNWVAPRGQPLRVWIPTTHESEAAERLARGLFDAVKDMGWIWVDDPTEQTPTHVLRWQGEHWQLVDTDTGAWPLGSSPDVEQVLAALAEQALGALFVHLPAPAALAERFALDAEGQNSIVEPVSEPGLHHYFLAGRWSGRRVEYAWLRAGVVAQPPEGDAGVLLLPPRSGWMAWNEAISDGGPSVGSAFRQENRLLKLARIHAWHTLRSPSGDRFPYTLSIRSTATGEAIGGRALVDGTEYGLALVRSPGAEGIPTAQRYVYVFTIDSEGNGVLLFPDPYDPQENRLPLSPSGEIPFEMASPDEIQLGQRLFRASAPYGTDSFFLLTSAEPITNPLEVFEFEGVRRGPPRSAANPLEQLLLATSSTQRGSKRITTTGRWSLEGSSHEVVSAAEAR